MIRALLRLVVVVVVLAAVAAFFLGYRIGPRGVEQPGERPVGTTGAPVRIDTERARATGAAIGAKVAAGANEAERALAETALTAKIKSKMALDDSVKASSIDVHTTNGVVTLTGTVRSEAERTRAVQLARETQGVTSVTDRLTIR
jgi:hypothetical protein